MSWVATVAVFVLTCASTAVSLLAYQHIERRQEVRTLAITAMEACERFADGVEAISYSLQAYAVTGDVRYRRAYLAGRGETRSLDRSIATLRTIPGAAHALELLTEAKRRSDALAGIEGRILDVADRGDFHGAAALAFGPEYLPARDAIRATAARAQDEIREWILTQAAQLSDIAEAKKRTALILYAANFLTVLVALGWGLQRKIVHPLVTLTDNTKSIVAGNRDVQFGYQSNHSEVGDLARALSNLYKAEEARAKEMHSANEALRGALDEQKAIFDAAISGITLVRNRVIIRCNRALEEMFGYPPGAMVGMNTRPWYADQATYEAVGREIEDALVRNERFFREERLFRKNGSQFWCRMTCQAVDAQDLSKGIVGINTDITAEHDLRLAEAKRTAEMSTANEALRVALEEQKAIFDAATSGIALIKDRVVIRCNRALEEIFEYPPGSMVGMNTRAWYRDQAAYDSMGKELNEDLIEHVRLLREEQCVRRNGSLFWCRLTARWADPQDRSKGLVGMVSDITAEREHDEALLRAKEAAEGADRLKSAFLATMSHELRTPLNSIIGFTGLLQQELVGPLNAEQKKQLGIVRSSSSHLLDLINDVLDLSRIDAGEVKLKMEAIDLKELTAKVIQGVQPLAEKKGLTLSCECPELPGPFRCDRRRVEQILVNLLSNAIKFTATGGVRLTVASTEATIRLEVIDTGVGIAPADLQRLFLPFSQLDTGTARKYEGTGLGLSICKRLTELLGGKISVESVAAQGSTFSVELPREVKT